MLMGKRFTRSLRRTDENSLKFNRVMMWGIIKFTFGRICVTVPFYDTKRMPQVIDRSVSEYRAREVVYLSS